MRKLGAVLSGALLVFVLEATSVRAQAPSTNVAAKGVSNASSTLSVSFSHKPNSPRVATLSPKPGDAIKVTAFSAVARRMAGCWQMTRPKTTLRTPPSGEGSSLSLPLLHGMARGALGSGQDGMTSLTWAPAFQLRPGRQLAARALSQREIRIPDPVVARGAETRVKLCL